MTRRRQREKAVIRGKEVEIEDRQEKARGGKPQKRVVKRNRVVEEGERTRERRQSSR